MNTVSNKMVCVSQALAAKAKGELAVEQAKLEVLEAANLLAQALVQALAEAQNCKTLRELREQVEDNMVDVREEHDTAWVLNTLRALDIEDVADNLNGMLVSIACIMQCKRNAEMSEHFRYFGLGKAKVFFALRRLIARHSNTIHWYQETVQRWTKLVGVYAKDRLPAVAVPKKERKHAIAQHYAAWTDCSTGKYIYWQPLQTSKYPFRTWCMALVVERISKNWYVGSI